MVDATPLFELGTKMCRRCKQVKELEDFPRRSKVKDGRNSWCRACHRENTVAKPNGTCSVDGCARATSKGARKCDSCHAGKPPLPEGLRTRGMSRYDAQGDRLCSDCLIYLPVSQFGVHNRVPDGLSRFCRACARAKNVRKKYGLTIQQAEEMWASPCGICGFYEAGKMVIDHCHASGVVRGTLCHPCNVSIGHFEDDPELLERAAEYLRCSVRTQGSQGRPRRAAGSRAPRTRGWTTHRRTSTGP